MLEPDRLACNLSGCMTLRKLMNLCKLVCLAYLCYKVIVKIELQKRCSYSKWLVSWARYGDPLGWDSESGTWEEFMDSRNILEDKLSWVSIRDRGRCQGWFPDVLLEQLNLWSYHLTGWERPEEENIMGNWEISPEFT